ncbi:MAG: folate-binding protein YgfZ [Granulosicoccus sp.]
MVKEWVETLRDSGINDDIGAVDLINQVDAVPTAGVQMVDLSKFRIVEITGNDASNFLQGQFCNDLSQVSSTRAQLTGYCTPKGRLLALPIIVGFEGGFRLLVSNDVADGFIKRLSMFVMRSDVTISERDDWICTGIIADESDSLGAAAQHLGARPLSPLDAASNESQQLIRWHDDFSGGASSQDSQPGRARFLFLASIDDQTSIWASSPDLDKRSQATWRLGDITAGVPTMGEGTIEAFVPQMLNLQHIDALSFTKGCYPGQEIVARMQYLGKLKRHMRLFRGLLAKDTNVPVAGDSLSAGEDADAGTVVDAIAYDQKDLFILAVTKVSANSAVFAWSDTQLQAIDLPYGLPSLDEAKADAS